MPANIILPADGDANWGDTLNTAITLINGAKSADDLTDGTTFRVYTTAEKTKLAGISAGATANLPDATLLNRANHTGTQSADTILDGTANKVYTAAEKTKLAGLTGTGASVSYSTTIGDGTTSSFTISHGLSTRDVFVEIYGATTPWQTVDVDTYRPTVNTVNIVFGTAPATNSYRVLIRSNV